MEGVITISKKDVLDKQNKRWVASSDKRDFYCHSSCKSCVIKIMLNLTKNSTTYHTIEVHHEDGKTIERIPTGVVNAGNS